MKHFLPLLTIIATFLVHCRQHHGSANSAADKKLTCLVWGYDSVTYYTGNSQQMQDINNGKITDTVFVEAMFRKIKEDSLAMVIKPGGGGGMMDNLREMCDLANNHNIVKRSLDSGDIHEDKTFGFSTPPMIKSLMRVEAGEPEPSHLFLPKDDADSPNALSKIPKKSQFVILLAGAADVYAYMGGDMRSGKKYSYPEITDFLKEKAADKKFFVVIKPSETSTYKNTVNMLDAMTIAHIQHYALIDITNEEKSYLHQVFQ